MEIVSIPLEGELEHADSMGNKAVIRKGDIQAMSAGTGIMHSEYNASKVNPVKFLQIWILPNRQNIPPQYSQITLNVEDRKNKLQQIVSPRTSDTTGVTILQDAWFHLGDLKKGIQLIYKIKREGNGAYLFILSGSVHVEGQRLSQRDGMGIWDTDQVAITAESDSELLLMDVPMDIP